MRKINLFTCCFLLLLSTLVNAQTTCPYMIAEKSGTVHSINRGELQARSQASKVTIRIKKTGGRARTEVDIYVGSTKRTIEFESGNYTTGYREVVLHGANDKQVRVLIYNKSATKTFQYHAEIFSDLDSFLPSGGAQLLSTDTPREFTFTVDDSCTDKVQISITKLGGNASPRSMPGPRRPINVFFYKEKYGGGFEIVHSISAINPSSNEWLYHMRAPGAVRVVVKASPGDQVRYAFDIKPYIGNY